MPLTTFQRSILALLARSRTPDSHLAGGAALHFEPNSARYTRDLDLFHDTVERVGEAFEQDRQLLVEAGYVVAVEMSQPGFIRAVVRRDDETRIDWAHDSAWRFMPPVRDPLGGYMLHDVDLAVNKTLALAGRDEPRDYIDILFIHERILPLAALCWAAVGKDPGFSPLSLLELLKRRGRLQPQEVARLELAEPVDLVASKQLWLKALDEADMFVRSRPSEEIGCLYYSWAHGQFALPEADIELSAQQMSPHFGAPGGILPQPVGSGL